MKKIIFILIVLLFSTFSCKEVEILSPIPLVETVNVIHTPYTVDVIGQGEVIDNGGIAISARGICWSDTSNEPTIDDITAIATLGDEEGLGSFSCNITDLEEGQTYYARAYAVNEGGVAYGETKNFTTSIQFPGNTQIVEAGTFLMGSVDSSADESPQHTVTLDTTFWMSTYEITNAQYAVFMNNIGVNPDGFFDSKLYIDMDSSACQIEYNTGDFEAVSDKADYPVIVVSWYGAKAFSEYYGGRLPTEAEWEYAVRGGNLETTTLYAGSNTVEDVAWYYFNAENTTHKVGLSSEEMQANELGLYHMSGNVMEWCADYYGSTYYEESLSNNPTGPLYGSQRVVRGGSYRNIANYCRVSDRYKYNQNNTYDHVGFRPVFPY